MDKKTIVKSREGKNSQIEGLRTLGCIAIVTFHLLYRYFQIYFPESIQLIRYHWCARLGEVGVLLFLIISVWHMDSHTEKRWNNGFLKTFRKYFRLFPEYVLSITITYVCSFFLPLGERSVSLKTYLLNLTMLEGFIPGAQYVDGAHWYITTLLAITFWVSLIEGLAERKHEWGCLGLLILCVLLRKMRIFAFLWPFLGIQYMGVAIFVLEVKRTLYNRRGNTILTGICIMSATIYTWWQHDFIYILCMCGLLVIFFCCVKGKFIILASRSLCSFARVSYPYYLVHQNLSYMLLNAFYIRFQLQDRWTHFIVAFIVALWVFPVVLCIQFMVKRISNLWEK